MADFYDEMADVVREMLAPTDEGGLGQGSIQLVRYTPGAAPANPWDPPAAQTRGVTPLNGAARGVSKEFIGAPVENGGQIVASDLQIIVAPWGGNYQLGDVIEIDTMALTVLKAENIPAAGTVCAVRFFGRQIPGQITRWFTGEIAAVSALTGALTGEAPLAGSIASSSTITLGPPEVPRALDTSPLPWFSYGLRRQRTTTTAGPLVQIHRSSGTPGDADFGTAGGDFLDTASAAAFVGVTTPTVRSLYDQTQSFHATQTTVANQPGIVFDGVDSYISFSSGKFLNLGDLNFARYRDGVTVVLVFRLPSNPDTTRTLFSFSSNVNAAGVRVWLRSSNASAITMLAAPYDGQTGYSSTPAISVGSAWTVAVLRVDFRNGVAKLLINGTTAVATPTMTECTKSANTASFGARINGTSTDTGMALHVKAFEGYDYVVSDEQAVALAANAYSTISGDKALITPPTQTPPDFAGAPSRVRFVGNSYWADTLITNPKLRTVPTFCELNAADGTYRLGSMEGTSGQTSLQIRTRFTLTAINAAEPAVFWMAQNDDVATTTANHATAIANTQACIDHNAASGKYLVCTEPFWVGEEIGTTKHDNKTIYNNLIKSTWPNNYIDMAAILSNYNAQGITLGRTPDVLLADTGHRNSLGAAVQAAAVKAALAAKSY